MNYIVFGKVHRIICEKLRVPLSAINVLSVNKSIVSRDDLLIHYEFNDRNQAYEYYYVHANEIDKTAPLVRKSNKVGYFFTSTDCDTGNSDRFKFAELPEVKILLQSDNPYSDCVKELILLSFLSFFELAKKLYPYLFEELAPMYTGFQHALINPDKMLIKDALYQDVYIKLLTIFNIPVEQELIYTRRMLELDGLLTKYTSNSVYYLNGYKNDWLPFRIENKKVLAIKFANEFLRASQNKHSECVTLHSKT
jgi:hypothetical protein